MTARWGLLLACMADVMVLLGHEPTMGNEEDQNQVAKRLFENGITMFANGEFKLAAESFRQAYRLRPSYKILFNIGQAEASSGRLGLAFEAFQQYLVEGADGIEDDRKDYVLNEIRRIKDLIADLEVEAPDGTIIYVDGVLRGTTPLLKPVIVEGNVEHTAAAVFKSGARDEKKFSVWGGRSVKIAFKEKPATQAPPAPAPVIVKPLPPPAKTPEKALEDSKPQGEKRVGLDPMYVWIGLGATGVFGAVTLGIELGGDQKIDEIHGDPNNDSLRDEAKTMQAAGIAFLVLTGAAAVTTGVLAIFTDFESPGDEAKTGMAVAPWATGDSGGLGVVGRF